MATDDETRSTAGRPLIEVSPDLAERLRDPRILLAIVAVAAGAIALFAGYLGVSGTLDPAKQIPYLVSGGVGGLFLLGLAAALLFSSDLSTARREVRELRDVVDRMAAQLDDLHGRAGDADGGRAPGARRPARAPARTRS